MDSLFSTDLVREAVAVYELIYGKAANDDILAMFTLYAGGELTKEAIRTKTAIHFPTLIQLL